MHVVRIVAKRSAPARTSRRASSGGSPRLGAKQAWPSCGYCGESMSLYLQFDVPARFGLVFAPGSHFLLFNCARCDAIPEAPPRSRLPASWLKADRAQSYRAILNLPQTRERALPSDRSVREQSIVFEAVQDRLTEGLDGPVGRRDFKVGGAPAWVQPPQYLRCACGAQMGFLLQVPSSTVPRWKSRSGASLPFCADLDAFVFACSAQCNPYATAIIAQR